MSWQPRPEQAASVWVARPNKQASIQCGSAHFAHVAMRFHEWKWTIAQQKNVFCSEITSEVTLGRELKRAGEKKGERTCASKCKASALINCSAGKPRELMPLHKCEQQ